MKSYSLMGRVVEIRYSGGRRRVIKVSFSAMGKTLLFLADE